MAKASDKRTFVQLAHTFKEGKDDPTGWGMSIKYDGFRCLWDGGISIGMKAKDVPFANTVKEGGEDICTGLWSRGGKVYHAPKQFTDGLPMGVLLDGELYNSKILRQDLSSIVRNEDRVYIGEWERVEYHLYDSPSYKEFFKTGRIHDGKWETNLFEEDMLRAFPDVKYSEPLVHSDTRGVFERIKNTHTRVVEQIICSGNEHLAEALIKATERGEEGLMLRNPSAAWEVRRSHNCLKVKKFDDAEGKVVGYVSGNITDTNINFGKLGTILIEEPNGSVFEVASLPQEERLFTSDKARTWAEENPGKLMPEWVQAKTYKIGDVVTFKFWGRTKDGLPNFAQIWRKKIDE